MERFTDQPLGDRPHIAVLSSSKLGNFVVTTPLLRGLKEKYPGATVDFFGSEATRALEERCPHVDYRFSLTGTGDEEGDDLAAALSHRRIAAGPYDLAINCDEFAEVNTDALVAIDARFVVGGAQDAALASRLGPPTVPEHHILEDSAWHEAAFLDRHADTITSGFIAEIFCRVAFVRSDPTRLSVATDAPDMAVPDVLFHVTATRSAKMWPTERWVALASRLVDDGASLGLVGSPPARQAAEYNAGDAERAILESGPILDLRGRTALTLLGGVLSRARALVTVDAGPLHVAAAVGCPTVAIFGCDDAGVGASPRRLWCPPVPTVQVTRSSATCTICAEHRFSNRACLVDGHPCMAGVDVDQVHALVRSILESTPPPRSGERP